MKAPIFSECAPPGDADALPQIKELRFLIAMVIRCSSARPMPDSPRGGSFWASLPGARPDLPLADL